MGRVNTWLVRRLDKLPDPAPLPPKLEQMRYTIERSISRSICVALVGFGGLSLTSDWILSLPYGVFLFVPLFLLLAFVLNVTMGYNSRVAVREYTRWLAAQPRTQRPYRRVTRVGVPYDRQPPTASTACPDCPAQPGQRHARSCPSVPSEWFSRGQ